MKMEKTNLVAGHIKGLSLPSGDLNADPGKPGTLGLSNGALRRTTNNSVWSSIPTHVSIIPPGQARYTSPGTYSWVVPKDVTRISAVCIGGGQSSERSSSQGSSAGHGGDLRWIRSIDVSPGETLTIVVGAPGERASDATRNGKSSVIRRGNTELLVAAGGGLSNSTPISAGVGGGNGGKAPAMYDGGGGGGGAGGYSGNGGDGASYSKPATSGQGGAGAGGEMNWASSGRTVSNVRGAHGGGTDIYGLGASGQTGDRFTTTYSAASGGVGSKVSATTTEFGGGAYSFGKSWSGAGQQGGGGAVRLIWGAGREYPSTDT